MELNTVPWFIVVSDRCEGGTGGAANDVEVERNFRELISVGHPNLQGFTGKLIRLSGVAIFSPPDLELISKSFEEGVGTISDLFNVDVGKPVFSVLAFGDLPFQLPCHFLRLD